VSKARLVIVPCALEDANRFVRMYHRHHRDVPGHKFSLAVVTDDAPDRIVGVAIISRPTARMSDDAWTLEVVRVATDGTDNACSALYGSCRRATFALGYRRLITYTLPEESGASLRGAGWRLIGEAGGGKWGRADRPRTDAHPLQAKLRWEAVWPA